nr:dna mismatch repair protein msh6 [Quercus suber]
MARGLEGNEIATPRPAAKGKMISSQSKTISKQRSIAGFFQKTAATNASTVTPAKRSSNIIDAKDSLDVPSSSADFPTSSNPQSPSGRSPLQSSVTEADGLIETPGTSYSSPARKVKKPVSYAESDDEDEDEDEAVFKPLSGNRRAAKRRRISVKDESDDEFGFDDATQAAMDNADEILAYSELTVVPDMDDFVVDDDDDEPLIKAKKRKPASSLPKAAIEPPSLVTEESEQIPTESTARQWTFDPDAPVTERRPAPTPAKRNARSGPPKKQKAHTSEPSDRYPWLAHIVDADRHPPDHPDYDPRTLYVPPGAWNNFSPFEKQYWEIKCKFWDTIVFFKKGKFYELYENDATVGHQLFDLKLTDRVNMRMVGVPEASLDHWANQFVAKGFKIARVDQMETALGKDMRERSESKKKEAKVIRRELASVLTAGTLVDGGMLQDDMATYCAAIKETERDGKPTFGIAFVDTATAQFHLAYFTDDADMTRFETFVAQTRPGELLLEKSCLSAKALRILKNNTAPTTIWNYLKPDKEFLSAEKTRMKIDGEAYFDRSDEDQIDTWPVVLREAKEKEQTFSALGALIWYLSLLKIERDLITCGNFSWYDPIRKASSLVLDGQSLINLEIFANTFDGTADGTLFNMLNRCITPFGKRMLRQWVCHPLADAKKINQRFDAVDALNADGTIMDRFTASLSRLPDLERLISRVHAGRCRPQDFVRVLEGFEQIEYTMSMLKSFGSAGEGVLGQLISAMPDLAGALQQWNDAFDRTQAKENGLFIPQPGVEEDFDDSQKRIDDVLKSLDKLLSKARKEFGSSSIKFTDNGKEIYQLEIPVKVKASVPKNWRQMSATKAVKRWYSPELEGLVQELKEEQETHGQVVRALAGRFFARFDEKYAVWLAAIKIVAQLDCLISLAKASNALGSPSCRPEFVEEPDARGVLDFQTLRHPCTETTTNFIPNDITLGGPDPNITLLTGANAAGKSTILRMTCIAVILAQIGCCVPCESARMTPVDRIMSRLGAQDNIFAGQSTFMVELSETKKILSEATPRSLVILDELGRGTSSYDGVAVAQAVLHHIATHIGALGYFATHYHSLATEFHTHPEIAAKRMAVRVEPDLRDVTFLYRLEAGVAEGSYGMHCAAMCGIASKIIDRAELAAQNWEHTGRIKESVEKAQESSWLPLGLLSDVSWMLKDRDAADDEDGEGGGSAISARSLDVLRQAIAAL